MINRFIKSAILVVSIQTIATATPPVPDYWHVSGVKSNDSLSMRTQPI